MESRSYPIITDPLYFFCFVFFFFLIYVVTLMGHNTDPLALVTQTNELTHEVGLVTGIMAPIITSESGSLLNLVFKITWNCWGYCWVYFYRILY